jgi:hypothetical protein
VKNITIGGGMEDGLQAGGRRIGAGEDEVGFEAAFE